MATRSLASASRIIAAMTNEFSFRTRRDALKDAAANELDVVVIGGGITGAGIAWDAATRGLHTAVFERRDFAHATSSKTSKMIHGRDCSSRWSKNRCENETYS